MKRIGRKGMKKAYMPIHHIPNKKKKKVRDFTSCKGVSDDVNIKGIEAEKSVVNTKQVIFAIFMLAAILLIIFDFKDEGMEFSVFGFKYSGTSVGFVILVFMAFLLLKTKSNITINN